MDRRGVAHVGGTPLPFLCFSLLYQSGYERLTYISTSCSLTLNDTMQMEGGRGETVATNVWLGKTNHGDYLGRGAPRKDT